MSSYRSRAKEREDALVDDVNRDSKAEKALMCRAEGCPLRWSVNTDGRVHLCSAHAWNEPHRWPQITQALQQRVDDHLRGVEPKAAASKPAPATRNEALAKLQAFSAQHQQHANEVAEDTPW